MLSDLYRRANAGDKEAIEVVLGEMWGRLQTVSKRYFSPGHSDEDNFQILLTGAWMAIASFKPDRVKKGNDLDAVFRSWIVAMAERYLWRDFQSRNPERRGRNKTAELSECSSLDEQYDDDAKSLNDFLEDPKSINPLDMVVTDETNDWLHFLIQNLDPEKKEVIEKYYLENRSFADIGREKEKSREWISKLHKMALERLQVWWQWEVQAEKSFIDDMAKYFKQRWEYEKKYGLRLHEPSELEESRPKMEERRLPQRSKEDDEMAKFLRKQWEYEKKYGLRLHDSSELEESRPKIVKRPPRSKTTRSKRRVRRKS